MSDRTTDFLTALANDNAGDPLMDPLDGLRAVYGHPTSSADVARTGIRLAFRTAQRLAKLGLTMKLGLDHFEWRLAKTTALIAAHDAGIDVLLELVSEMHPAGRDEVLRRVNEAKKAAEQSLRTAEVAASVPASADPSPA